MTNLGYMHFNGLGVRADRAEAIRWYRSAAAAGQAVAQYSLANMYENGWGVAKDMTEARRWYAAAADQGDADAEAALRRLAQTSALPDAAR
jgi:TPR repeat protein